MLPTCKWISDWKFIYRPWIAPENSRADLMLRYECLIEGLKVCPFLIGLWWFHHGLHELHAANAIGNIREIAIWPGRFFYRACNPRTAFAKFMQCWRTLRDNLRGGRLVCACSCVRVRTNIPNQREQFLLVCLAEHFQYLGSSCLHFKPPFSP